MDFPEYQGFPIACTLYTIVVGLIDEYAQCLGASAMCVDGRELNGW